MVGDGISEPGEASVSMFHAVPSPEEKTNDSEPDSRLASVQQASQMKIEGLFKVFEVSIELPETQQVSSMKVGNVTSRFW